MTDYKHIYSKRLIRRDRFSVYGSLAAFVLILGVVGHFEKQEPQPEPPPIIKVADKSPTQERIEQILPQPVAAAIATRTEYPRTLAAIAHTESRGNHKAVGDSGKARGLFQVWPSHHGPVPADIEGQVDQANRLFLAMVHEYGYRGAVARWNGTPSNPKVKQYQRTVLAKVEALR